MCVAKTLIGRFHLIVICLIIKIEVSSSQFGYFGPTFLMNPPQERFPTYEKSSQYQQLPGCGNYWKYQEGHNGYYGVVSIPNPTQGQNDLQLVFTIDGLVDAVRFLKINWNSLNDNQKKV